MMSTAIKAARSGMTLDFSSVEPINDGLLLAFTAEATTIGHDERGLEVEDRRTDIRHRLPRLSGDALQTQRTTPCQKGRDGY
jgi:hypothetical protein